MHALPTPLAPSHKPFPHPSQASDSHFYTTLPTYRVHAPSRPGRFGSCFRHEATRLDSNDKRPASTCSLEIDTPSQMCLPLQEDAIKNIRIFACYSSDISASNAILISRKGGDLSKQDRFDARVSGFLTMHSRLFCNRTILCKRTAMWADYSSLVQKGTTCSEIQQKCWFKPLPR
jgi:hypothetical protein